MELRFLGAATTVTGSQFLLTTSRAKVLIDCGMFQGNPHEAIRNRVPLAYDPTEIDALLLTHAHLDHCGLIPLVVAQGMRAPIFATAGTMELATLVLLDSAKLQQEAAKRDARFERRHPGRAARVDRVAERDLRGARDEAAAADSEAAAEQHDPETELRSQLPEFETSIDDPLYTEADAQAALRLFRAVGYGRETLVAAGVRATLYDAGHILGSAIVRLQVSDGDTERVIVFSGDLGRPGTPIIRDPTIISDADYVIVESTYGGREHEPQEEAVRLLAEVVRLVADLRGVLLVPSFAIGRTQEVVWQLDRLLDKGTIPRLPLYLDSPMASKATDIYRRHPEYFDEEMRALLAKRDDPLDYPGAVIANDIETSRGIANAPRPYMIVASNGMLTGGRVLNHLRNVVGDRGRCSCSSATRVRARSARTSRRARARCGSTAGCMRCAARSARSAASQRTRTSPSCSAGCATSRRVAGCHACSWSTATLTRRPRSRRRSARSASRCTRRSGTSARRSTRTPCGTQDDKRPDLGRELVVSGHASPLEWTEETTHQFALARGSAARMAADYSDEGFAAIIDDVVREEDLDQFVRHLAGRPLTKVVLIPRLDVVFARNRTRTNKSFDTSMLEPVARRLYRSLIESCRPADGWLAIDTTDLDVAATVTEILRRVARG